MIAESWRPLWLLLLLPALLAGCGFHPRGSFEMPPGLSPVFVEGGKGTPLREHLLKILEEGGVGIAASPDRAQTILRIYKQENTQRVSAVDSSGKVAEYELHYRVDFGAVDHQGNDLTGRQSIDLAQTYINPDVEVLGKQEEADLIRQDQVREMVRRILRRLRAQRT